MELCEMIARRRKALGKTLEQIAEETGVAKATVQRWESGAIRNVRSDKIAKLARALEITPEELVGAEAVAVPTADRAPTPAAGPDREVEEYLEYLKNRSEMRMLFSVSKDATKEDIMRAVAIIEALKQNGGGN